MVMVCFEGQWLERWGRCCLAGRDGEGDKLHMGLTLRPWRWSTRGPWANGRDYSTLLNNSLFGNFLYRLWCMPSRLVSRFAWWHLRGRFVMKGRRWGYCQNHILAGGRRCILASWWILAYWCDEEGCWETKIVVDHQKVLRDIGLTYWAVAWTRSRKTDRVM